MHPSLTDVVRTNIVNSSIKTLKLIGMDFLPSYERGGDYERGASEY